MKVRNTALQTLLIAAVLSVLALTTAHAAHHKQGEAAAEVMIADAYARAARQGNSAVFMTLINHGASDHAIVGVSGDVAKAVELHTHLHEGGMMRMRQVDKIAIPAGGKASLQPGGDHVMLIGLHKALEAGDMVHVTLEFADGSTKMIMAPVKSATAVPGNMDSGTMKPMEGHNHNM